MAEAMQILLAEDNPEDAELVREVLEDTGVRCVLNVVEDGVQALAYLRQEGKFNNCKRPDVILLDLNMPRLNGFGVLEEIRNSGPKGIPVVVLTVSEDQEEIVKAMQLQMNYYMRKPVECAQLTQLLTLVHELWRVK